MVGTAPAFLLTEYCLWEPYYHLTDNAPEADKKALEEYMNREIFVGLIQLMRCAK